MKKFLSIIAAVGLTATASTAVVACGTKNDSKDEAKTLDGIKSSYELEAGVDPTPNSLIAAIKKEDATKDLNLVANLSEASAPEAKDQAVYVVKISDAVREETDVIKFNIEKHLSQEVKEETPAAREEETNEGEGTETPTSPKFEWNTEVAATLEVSVTNKAGETDEQVELSTKIDASKLALGELENDAAATAAVQAVVDELKLTNEVTLGTPAENKLVVTSKSDSKIVKGEVTFTYTVKAGEADEQVELSTKIDASKLALGELENDAAATAAAQAVVDELKLTNEVTLGTPTENKLVVTSKSDSKIVKGEVTFTYTVKAKTE